jgi:hypothetical protein
MDRAARGWTRFLVLVGLIREPGSPPPASLSRRQRIAQAAGLVATGFVVAGAKKLGF